MAAPSVTYCCEEEKFIDVDRLLKYSLGGIPCDSWLNVMFQDFSPGIAICSELHCIATETNAAAKKVKNANLTLIYILLGLLSRIAATVGYLQFSQCKENRKSTNQPPPSKKNRYFFLVIFYANKGRQPPMIYFISENKHK